MPKASAYCTPKGLTANAFTAADVGEALCACYGFQLAESISPTVIWGDVAPHCMQSLNPQEAPP
jgi:hypothetical protein